jgi:hypothetical protein
VIGLRGHRRRAPLVLGGVALGLCALIYGESRQFTGVLPVAVVASSSTRKAEAVATPSRFTLPPLSGYAEVTARPLFSETRRPPLEAASLGDAQSATFVLIGIVISATERYALIEHGRPLHLDRAREGQELDGWTVMSVLPDRVLFQRGDRNLELKARDRAPTAREIQPAPPAPRAPNG